MTHIDNWVVIRGQKKMEEEEEKEKKEETEKKEGKAVIAMGHYGQ